MSSHHLLQFSSDASAPFRTADVISAPVTRPLSLWGLAMRSSSRRPGSSSIIQSIPVVKFNQSELFTDRVAPSPKRIVLYLNLSFPFLLDARLRTSRFETTRPTWSASHLKFVCRHDVESQKRANISQIQRARRKIHSFPESFVDQRFLNWPVTHIRRAHVDPKTLVVRSFLLG